MDHCFLVQFSGGIGSWAAAKRCAAKYGPERVHLLFADTLIEDDDLYRFLIQGAADVRGFPLTEVEDLVLASMSLPDITEETLERRKAALADLRAKAMERLPWLTWIAEGRTPWEVFRDERYIGNSRVDPCSKILKRELCDAWRAKHTSPETTVAVLGIGWDEIHRYERAVPRFAPWRVIAPLCERPFSSKTETHDAIAQAGIAVPRLYERGFPHNNCRGWCVKAGLAQFAHLLRTDPEYYLYNERQEDAVRDELGKDVTVLRDRRGGKSKPMPMRQYRARLEGPEAAATLTEAEGCWGGCGCFSD